MQLGEEPCVELLLLRLPHSHPGRYVAVGCLLLLLRLHGRLLLDRLLQLLLLLLLRLIWLAILVWLAVSGAAQLWAATCAALRIALSLAALAALATGAWHGEERGEWRGGYD